MTSSSFVAAEAGAPSRHRRSAYPDRRLSAYQRDHLRSVALHGRLGDLAAQSRRCAGDGGGDGLLHDPGDPEALPPLPRRHPPQHLIGSCAPLGDGANGAGSNPRTHPMPHPVSPLAPKAYPTLPPVAGVRFATAEAGIKYKNRTDVLLVELAEGTAVAGVLTKSKCPSAAVDWCRDRLPGGTARALLVNSGNANAFTGQKGRASVAASAAYAAAA